jgi:hypothetical protein
MLRFSLGESMKVISYGNYTTFSALSDTFDAAIMTNKSTDELTVVYLGRKNSIARDNLARFQTMAGEKANQLFNLNWIGAAFSGSNTECRQILQQI